MIFCSVVMRYPFQAAEAGLRHPDHSAPRLGSHYAVDQAVTVKTLLRKGQARSLDAVSHAIARILTACSRKECANYLRIAGYAST